jgi:hypothetical protein
MIKTGSEYIRVTTVTTGLNAVNVILRQATFQHSVVQLVVIKRLTIRARIVTVAIVVRSHAEKSS